jgi:hypothetical protein
VVRLRGSANHSLDSTLPRNHQPRERAQGAPGAFELVDPGDEAPDLQGDLENVGFQHEPIPHPFTPIYARLGVKMSSWGNAGLFAATDAPNSPQQGYRLARAPNRAFMNSCQLTRKETKMDVIYLNQ